MYIQNGEWVIISRGKNTNLDLKVQFLKSLRFRIALLAIRGMALIPAGILYVGISEEL